jgi:hypothetical protein
LARIMSFVTLVGNINAINIVFFIKIVNCVTMKN